MKRVWFNTLKGCGYMPLRVWLGLVSPPADFGRSNYCIKPYTTRMQPMQGECVVVSGSRFSARPVRPVIMFRVRYHLMLDLRKGMVSRDGKSWQFLSILDRDGLTFPELDLGVRGATMEDLRGTLLGLNRGATLDTKFYVNLIEPVERRGD